MFTLTCFYLICPVTILSHHQGKSIVRDAFSVRKSMNSINLCCLLPKSHDFTIWVDEIFVKGCAHQVFFYFTSLKLSQVSSWGKQKVSRSDHNKSYIQEIQGQKRQKTVELQTKIKAGLPCSTVIV